MHFVMINHKAFIEIYWSIYKPSLYEKLQNKKAVVNDHDKLALLNNAWN